MYKQICRVYCWVHPSIFLRRFWMGEQRPILILQWAPVPWQCATQRNEIASHPATEDRNPFISTCVVGGGITTLQDLQILPEYGGLAIAKKQQYTGTVLVWRSSRFFSVNYFATLSWDGPSGGSAYEFNWKQGKAVVVVKTVREQPFKEGKSALVLLSPIRWWRTVFHDLASFADWCLCGREAFWRFVR